MCPVAPPPDSGCHIGSGFLLLIPLIHVDKRVLTMPHHLPQERNHPLKANRLLRPRVESMPQETAGNPKHQASIS